MRQPAATAAVSEMPAREAAARVIALIHAVEGCSQSLRGAIDRVAGRHELSTSQLTTLWACGEASGGIGQSQLAARIGVSPAQASALVEQLRQRDLLVARRAANDRRRQQWSLTPTGRNVVESAAASLATLAARIEPALDTGEQVYVGEALARLSTVVKQIPSPTNGAFPRLCELADDRETNSDRLSAGGSDFPARGSGKREVRR